MAPKAKRQKTPNEKTPVLAVDIKRLDAELAAAAYARADAWAKSPAGTPYTITPEGPRALDVLAQ